MEWHKKGESEPKVAEYYYATFKGAKGAYKNRLLAIWKSAGGPGNFRIAVNRTKYALWEMPALAYGEIRNPEPSKEGAVVMR